LFKNGNVILRCTDSIRLTSGSSGFGREKYDQDLPTGGVLHRVEWKALNNLCQKRTWTRVETADQTEQDNRAAQKASGILSWLTG
jgi:hypothetical protein